MRVRVILWASLVLLMSVGFAKSAQTKEAVPIVYWRCGQRDTRAPSTRGRVYLPTTQSIPV